MIDQSLKMIFSLYNSPEEVPDESHFNKTSLRCGRLLKCEGEVCPLWFWYDKRFVWTNSLKNCWHYVGLMYICIYRNSVKSFFCWAKFKQDWAMQERSKLLHLFWRFVFLMKFFNTNRQSHISFVGVFKIKIIS